MCICDKHEWKEETVVIKNVKYLTRKKKSCTIPSLSITYDTIKNDGIKSLFGNTNLGNTKRD